MPKFILLDPSICDLRGHHYEYAERVLTAASQQGFETVLGVNRRCAAKSKAGAAVHPVFRHDFWYEHREPKLAQWIRGAARRTVGWLTCWGVRVGLSPLGLAWAERDRPIDLLERCASGRIHERVIFGALIIPLVVLRIVSRLPRLVRRLLPRSAPQARVAVEPRPNLLVSGEGMLRAALKLVLAARKARSFAADCQLLLTEVPVNVGDLVFVPTLGISEMQGLCRLFEQHPSSILASWHLVFRRNIYQGRDPEYRHQDESQRRLRNAFMQLIRPPHADKVHCYTDTEQLTTQYNRLGVTNFVTLPLPVGRAYHEQGTRPTNREKLTVAYVGDARTEKGYQHLPRLVQDVWSRYVTSGRLKFRLQSNYNVPQGEPPVVVARAQLEAMPTTGVELLHQPLASDAYRDLVCESDIILVLTDRDNYYARSSGTFGEAITAGKPVVVPAGSWMATQIAAPVARYHQQLVARERVLRRWTGSDLIWHVQGTSDARPFEDDELWLACGPVRYAWLAVPSDATHLLVTYRQGAKSAGHFVRVYLAQETAGGKKLSRDSAITGGGPDYPSSSLFKLDNRGRCAWLAFQGAFSGDPQPISELQITCISAKGSVARWAVGVVYHQPSELATALEELVEHFDHYRQTSCEMSAAWSEYHDQTTLVKQMAVTAGARGLAPLPKPHFEIRRSVTQPEMAQR